MTARFGMSHSARVQGRRFAVAALAVAAVIGLVVLPARLTGSEGSDRAVVEAPRGINDVDGLVACLESMAEAGLAEPSAAFLSEVGLPTQCRDVRADEDAHVVGFVLDEDVDAARQRIDRQLEARGFLRADLGGVAGSTFVKDGGAIPWALVTYTAAGDATSVVVRYTQRGLR